MSEKQPRDAQADEPVEGEEEASTIDIDPDIDTAGDPDNDSSGIADEVKEP